MKNLMNIMFVFFLSLFSGCYDNIKHLPIEQKSDILLNVRLVSIDSNKYNLRKALNSYGSYISSISKHSDLPENIIYSFLVVENQHFNNHAISSKNAIGLMQVKVGTANDIVIMAAKRGMISDFDKTNLTRLIGTKRYNELISAPCLGRNHNITESELTDPELNLLIGCMFLNILNKESNGNISEMGLRYLNGYFAFDCGKKIPNERIANSHYVNKLNDIHKTITKSC